ncbi:DNA repair protein recA homolog 3, mitochondrial-like isoform X2 [Durio zibethinus]|uniref:DNA repair protein recA homolog 3, mitochondrial-like isoform X2 n=1 Tax=Durio zibethinus TaxID=66656 RepID=A0A6P5ZQ34_DURZI|nr:DNA repair protein recA homolog 3, mitochondrial-like isoform X2 [Durio zibethinus]
MAGFLRNVSSLKRSLFAPEVYRGGVLGPSSLLCNFYSKGRRKSKSDGSDSSEENMSKKDLALKQALDQITDSFGKGSVMWLGRSVSLRNVPVVSTGSFALDIAIGTGGLPKGRVIEIFGPEASGKTTLALHVAALVPKGELEGEMGDAHMAMQARLMSQALRKLSHSLSLSQTILIFINQVRSKLSTFGGFGGPTEVTCGGNALKFYASLRLNIRRTGFVKKGEETIGSQVLVKIVKNKLAPPFKNAEFELLFGKGISREGEIIDLATKHKFVTRAGSFYIFNDQKIHGKEAFKKFLAEKESACEELVMKLREKLLEADSKKERQTDILDGDTLEEIISTDTTDEEAVTAVEA